MISKTLLSLSLMLCSASVYANPLTFGFLNIGSDELDNAVQSSVSAGLNRSSQCPDFSGVYTGRCDGVKEDLSFTIVQNSCESMTVDGEDHVIGSIEGDTQTANGLILIASRGFQWGQDGTLNISGVGHWQVNFEGTNIMSSYGYEAVLKQQGKILTIDGQSHDGEKISCIYAK